MTPEQHGVASAAQAAHSAGKIEEALNGFLRVTQMNPPGAVFGYDFLGHCLIALSRTAEGVEAYKIYVAVEKENPTIWSNLATLSFNGGEFTYAARCVDEMIRLRGPSVDTTLMRFLALFYAEADDEIPPVFEQFVDAYLIDFANLERLFQHIYFHPSLDRQDMVVEMLLGVGKHVLAVNLMVMGHYKKRGNLDRAIAVMDAFTRQKVRILPPEIAEAYGQLGEALLAAKDIPRAIDRLQRGMDRMRQTKLSWRIAHVLGYAHALEGRHEVATDFYRAAASAEPQLRFSLIRPSFTG